MNIAELSQPQPIPPPLQIQQTNSFGHFVSDTVTGLLEGYTQDSKAFVFLTGVALTVSDNKKLQRAGKGLMAYGALMQAGDYVGFLGSSLRFIGAVIRDNPYFLEKHLQVRVGHKVSDNE